MEGKEQASNALKEIIIEPRENSLFVRAEPKKAVGHKCNLIVGEAYHWSLWWKLLDPNIEAMYLFSMTF